MFEIQIIEFTLKEQTQRHTAHTPVVVCSACVLPEELAVFVDVSAQQQWTHNSVHLLRGTIHGCVYVVSYVSMCVCVRFIIHLTVKTIPS